MDTVNVIDAVEPETKKSERLEARVTRAQKTLFERAATLLGRTLTDFVVTSLEETSTRVVRQREIIALGAKDREVFVAALLKPPVLKGRLAQAVKRHHRAAAR